MGASMTRRLTLLLAMRGAKKVTGAVDRLKRSIFSLRTAFTTLAVSLGLGQFIQAAVRMDTLKRGLLAVSSSAREASNQMKVLEQVARLPGLGFKEAIEGSTQLQAAGFNAREAAEALMAFGNAIATTGGAAPELQRVILQLGQMSAAGKVMMQDLRPIIQTAPIVGKAMREAFGTISPQEIEKMGFSAKEFIQKLVVELGRLPKVTGGPLNAIENVHDALFRVRAFVGQRMLPAFENTLTRIEGLLTNNRDAVEKFANFLGNLGNKLVTLTVKISKWVSENRKVVLIVGAIGGAVLLLSNPIVQIGLVLVASIKIWKAWGEEIKDIVMATGDVIANMFSATGLALAIGRHTVTLAAAAIRIKDAILELPEIGKEALSALQKQFEDLLKPVDVKDPIADRLGIITELPAKVKEMQKKPIEPLSKVGGEFALINDPLRDLIDNMGDFASAIEFVGFMFEDNFGRKGVVAFKTAMGAGSAYFNTIQAMSKAYFKGESSRLINFKELTKQVYLGARNAALSAIADELEGLAKKYAVLALGALGTGNFGSAAKFGAAAALAGGSAAVISGFVQAGQESAASSLAGATGQPRPLTQEERAAGVTTARGGSFSGSTTSFSQQPQNVTISPVTTFNVHEGGILTIGSGGLEEAATHLSDVIVDTVIEASKNGRL